MQWVPSSKQLGQVVFQDLESWDATHPLQRLRTSRILMLAGRQGPAPWILLANGPR